MSQMRLNKIVLRYTALLFAVLILFLSPYSKYLDTSGIDKVYATGGEIAFGAVAGDAVLKILIGLFGTVAAVETYDKFEDEINQAYYDYMSAPGRWADLIGESAKETCIKIYDKASNTIKEIPWDEMMQSLADGHDQVVDNLTDLYAQYCPALLESFDEFISDVINGNVYVPGLSEVFIDDTFSDYESIQNIDGSYNISGYESYTSPDGVHINVIYNDSTPNKPFAVLSSSHGVSLSTIIAGDVNNSSAFQCNYTMYRNGKVTSSGSNYAVGLYTPLGSYGVNVPIYSSLNSAISALLTNDYSSALNYTDKTMNSVIDLTDYPSLAPDIPPFTKSWQREQWGQVSDIIDFGGSAAWDYADDLPFWGLAELDALAGVIQDVFDRTLKGIFEGTDVIEFPTTYDDVWDDAFTDAWEGVKDGALDIPVDDAGNPADTRPYPWNPDIPSNPDIDIPSNPDIDVPADSVVDIPIEDIVPTVNDSFFDIAGSLRYKFPFSIPWDIYHLFSILAGSGGSSAVQIQTYNISADNIQTYSGKTSDAPCFELPIVIERYGIDEKIIIDMAPFEPLSILSRTLFSLLFGMFLINLTFKVVGMRKEE